MSIHILPEETVNQIAAGEVVERPAHLVKELVENALDAGSTEVEIEVDHGGRDIRIVDNGKGIPADDLRLALSRHATSKISKFDDLYQLHTFGFRGEALASIAAVSRLTLASSIDGNSQGYRIESDFGAMQKPEPIGHGKGTSIQVRDLFANVPARLKFLKTDSAETTQIKTVLRAMALSAPNATFRIRSQGRLIEYWPATASKIERAQQLLGVEKLYLARSNNGIRCEVAFGAPSVVSKTSKNIWLFVQNRWVQDRALQAAILDAYRSLLMHGEYPYVVAWVDLDPADVDVNVHPTKSQVKFRDSSQVFRALHHTLRAELETAPWTPQVFAASQHAQQKGAGESEMFTLRAPESQATPLAFSDEELARRQTRALFMPQSAANVQADAFPGFASDSKLEEAAKPAKVDPSLTLAPSSAPTLATTATKSRGYWTQLEVIGQMHLTYILAQSHEGLVIVDQHAAHERVNFEKLLAGFQDGRFDRQAYLLPLAIDLDAFQVEALLLQRDNLNRLGVELEQTGPESVIVVSRPAFIDDAGVQMAVVQLANEAADRGGSFAFEKKLSDIIATMACHSSVRAGQALSVEQMRELLRSMDQYPLSTFCPHGRPVHVNFSFHKLERDFGRIV